MWQLFDIGKLCGRSRGNELVYWLNISGKNIGKYKAPSNHRERFVSSGDAICCQHSGPCFNMWGMCCCQVLSKKGWLILSGDQAALNKTMAQSSDIDTGGELQRQPFQGEQVRGLCVQHILYPLVFLQWGAAQGNMLKLLLPQLHGYIQDLLHRYCLCV